MSSQKGNLLDEEVLTEVDGVDAEDSKTLFAGFLKILGGAVDLVCLAALDKPELGGKEDLVTLPRAFEPLPQKFLVVSVKTFLNKSSQTKDSGDISTKSTYSALSQKVAPISRAWSRRANRSSSPGNDPYVRYDMPIKPKPRAGTSGPFFPRG